jgi:hypothetical protein
MATDQCLNCIKAMTIRNCKTCPSNPTKYIISISVQCDKDCSQYVDREELGCHPITGECLRADQVVQILTALGVLKQ